MVGGEDLAKKSSRFFMFFRCWRQSEPREFLAFFEYGLTKNAPNLTNLTHNEKILDKKKRYHKTRQR